jgi:hypothetical protein
MRTLAAIGFVAGVGALGVALGLRPTLAHHGVLADEVRSMYAGKGVTDVACDDAVPIGVDGARFGCTLTLTGGRRQRIACSLGRDGQLVATPIGAAAPSQIAPAGDPWAN